MVMRMVHQPHAIDHVARQDSQQGIAKGAGVPWTRGEQPLASGARFACTGCVPGWRSADADLVKVEGVSGCGGSKTYKVTATHACTR